MGSGQMIKFFLFFCGALFTLKNAVADNDTSWCVFYSGLNCKEEAGNLDNPVTLTECGTQASGNGFDWYQWNSICYNINASQQPCVTFAKPNCEGTPNQNIPPTQSADQCHTAAQSGGDWSYKWGNESCANLGQNCTTYNDPNCKGAVVDQQPTTTAAACGQSANGGKYPSYQWGSNACVSLQQDCTFYENINCQGTATSGGSTTAATCLQNANAGYPSYQWGNNGCSNTNNNRIHSMRRVKK